MARWRAVSTASCCFCCSLSFVNLSLSSLSRLASASFFSSACWVMKETIFFRGPRGTFSSTRSSLVHINCQKKSYGNSEYMYIYTYTCLQLKALYKPWLYKYTVIEIKPPMNMVRSNMVHVHSYIPESTMYLRCTWHTYQRVIVNLLWSEYISQSLQAKLLQRFFQSGGLFIWLISFTNGGILVITVGIWNQRLLTRIGIIIN